MRLFITSCLALALACGGLTPTEQPTEQPVEVPGSPPARPAATPLPSATISELPEWVRTGQCGMPQILDADAAMSEADATGPLEGGLLLCEVRLSGTPPKGRRWDAFGGNPDPSLQLNSHPSACAENIHDVTLSLHGLSLTIGDTVQATAVDVDLRRDDLAGTDSVTFEGWPLSLRGDHFSATCRALTPATVQARLPARQDAARQALSRLQQAMVPAPLQDNWGWPESEERTARRHIEDVAGHVGWTDAAAGALLANEAGLQAQWSEAVAASMAQTRASLPRTVTLSTGLTISITAMQCADDCQLTLSLRGPDRPLTFSPGSDLSLYLVLPDGRDHGLSISDELPEGVLSLAAGEQTDLHLHTSSVPSDRSMVRIKESNRQHLLPTPGS